jgi:hypothetical protein
MLFPEIKLAGRVKLIDFSAEFKNEWSFSSTPQYFFMV